MSDLNCPFCGDSVLFDVNVDSYYCVSCDITIHRHVWSQRTLPESVEAVLSAAREYASGGYEDSHTLNRGSIGEYMELVDALRNHDAKGGK